MAVKIPRPVWTQAIIDKAGLATKAFSRRIEEMIRYIEAQVQSLVDVVAAIQAVQDQQAAQLVLINEALGIANGAAAAAAAAGAAANGAQASADGGGSATARSGSATDSASLINTSWILGPTVNLTTVSAGTLSITGTTITAGTLTDGSVCVGEFRVVELAGGTTIFPTGAESSVFSVSSGGLAVEANTVASVAAFSLAQATTGSVGYRMDVRRSGGTVGSEADIDFYFYARRS